jgi:hypothetical protein
VTEPGAGADRAPLPESKVARLPTDCIAFHDETGNTPFRVLTHRAHFGTPEESSFFRRLGGDCRPCCLVDSATGEAMRKEAGINW